MTTLFPILGAVMLPVAIAVVILRWPVKWMPTPTNRALRRSMLSQIVRRMK